MKTYLWLGGLIGLAASGVYAACNDEQRQQEMLEIIRSDSPYYKVGVCVKVADIEAKNKLKNDETLELSDGRTCRAKPRLGGPNVKCTHNFTAYRSDEDIPPQDICFNSYSDFRPVLRRAQVDDDYILHISGKVMGENIEHNDNWKTGEAVFVWPLDEVPIANRSVYELTTAGGAKSIALRFFLADEAPCAGEPVQQGRAEIPLPESW